MRSEGSRVVASALENQIRRIIASKLQRDIVGIPGDQALTEVGFDKRGLSGLICDVEEHFDITAPDYMLPGTITVDGLVTLVEDLRRLDAVQQEKWSVAEAAD